MSKFVKAAVAGLLFSISACAAVPVGAAETACQYTLEETKPQLVAHSIPFTVLTDPAEVAAFVSYLDPAPEGVTAVLLAEIDGAIVYGLEIGGCLTPPTPLSAPEQLSGTAGGKTGA